MISLQVKTHPKKYLLIIPSVLDDFIPGENPPEEHILILLSVLNAFTSSEIPPEKIS